MNKAAPTPRTLRLSPDDNVLVAVDAIQPGQTLAEGIVPPAKVMRGHKLAARAIAAGEPVRKFGQIIGFASADIAPGSWVHEHNVVMNDFARDYAFSADAESCRVGTAAAPLTFEG